MSQVSRRKQRACYALANREREAKMATRLEQLMERQRKLEGQITQERGRAEAEKALGGILEALAEGHDLNPLEGKILHVVEGKIVLNGHGNGKPKAKAEGRATGNGNGNGHYEYVLADGRGPFASIQEALDAMGVAKDKRPRHNRWERLSDELQASITRRPKA